ncbi:MULTISPECIES: DJ-1/PfpI family protein [unclassified Streptomyces]|uniref:DJ-1/PfpI family protein n=1 Tax=unclassified Streptomyces TaxID=2593676 RepID=UPI001F17670A|nr:MULTISPECIES: DJ-1/PfpI family protein [unclassified Streptomyces]
MTVAATASPVSARGRLKGDRPIRVQILLYDGAEEQDFIGPRDVFGHAVHAGGSVETTLVRHGGPGEVEALFGTKIVVDREWDPADADILVIPGGGWGNPEGPGVHTVRRNPAMLRNLRRARQSGVVLAGVCTGVMALSAAGLVKGRPCTTHHLAADALKEEGGEVVRGRVVDNGNLITAGGVTSGLDLALWIVTRELGSPVTSRIEKVMEYEQRGAVWRRE